MRTPFALALLAVVAFFLLLAPQAEASSAMIACNRKSVAVRQAIQGYCKNQKLMIPSPYAARGFTARPPGGGRAWVNILGACRPPQWVPKKYCLSQFYSICIRGDREGRGGDFYGRNACQKWVITRN